MGDAAQDAADDLVEAVRSLPEPPDVPWGGGIPPLEAHRAELGVFSEALERYMAFRRDPAVQAYMRRPLLHLLAAARSTRRVYQVPRPRRASRTVEERGGAVWLVRRRRRRALYSIMRRCRRGRWWGPK